MFTLKPSDLSCWTVTKKISWIKKKGEKRMWRKSNTRYQCIYQYLLRCSLRTADAFPVVSDDRKCVRCSQANWDVETFNWYWPFVVFGSNSKDNGWLGREVDMRALKSGRADSAGGLGTTIHPNKGELDWARAWRRQPCYWFVVWLVVWLAAYGEVHGVFTHISSGIGRCFPR